LAHLFCFGYGDCAAVLSRRVMARGWTVTGTCRQADHAEDLKAEGVRAVVFDGLSPSPDVTAALKDATHILVSIAPDADGDPVLVHHGADIAALGDQAAWIGYLSATGVYGDRGGEWVDEDSALAPTTNRGRSRLDAEWDWLELGKKSGRPVHLFRLSGIYGPGRSQLDAVLDGTARRVIKEGQVFSRAHVDDIATVLEASIAAPNPGRAYNVCDDEPAPPQDVIAYAAMLLGRPLPDEVPFEDAPLSPMARTFYSESKRVSNKRIKEELGVTLRYPSYKEGLKALAAEMER
jgi:nucleoside-diphosphate-sugar epimerase